MSNNQHTEKTGNPIIDNLDIWSSVIIKKSATGRGSKSKTSPYGIQKLRELILELAVRGRLVPQDSDDEPASVLLEKIFKEKERQIKEGRIKKQKSLLSIEDHEKPFNLPSGWVWVRLGDLVYLEMGQSPPSKYYNQKGNGLPFFQGKADFGEKHPTPRYWCVQPQKYAYPNDVLLSVRAPVGPTNISNIECCIGRGLAALRPLLEVPPNFVNYLLKGFRSTLESFATGTTFAAVSKTNVENLVLSLPPLAEQLRIVAKVDELMDICGQLEKQQTDSLTAHQILVETLLNALVRPEPDEGSASEQTNFEQAWQRIAKHFSTLFTTEHSIDQLKQNILQLAVMGKLVPQDPSDEPASVFLDKIAEEKARLIKDGTIKKQKSLSEILEDEKVFDLPDGWEWVNLGNISVLKGGFAYKSTAFRDSGDHQVIRMGNIRPDYLRLHEKPVYISSELGEETVDYLIEVNDILLTMTGTKGKRDYLYSLMILPAHMEDRKLHLNQRLCIVRSVLLSPEYVNLTIKDDRLLDVIFTQSTGTANQANIGMLALNNWVFPLPPLDEQHRIVAKVDELMAICDVLKARIQEAKTTQVYLADAVVEQAVA